MVKDSERSARQPGCVAGDDGSIAAIRHAKRSLRCCRHAAIGRIHPPAFRSNPPPARPVACFRWMNTRRFGFAYTVRPYDYGSACLGCIPRPSAQRTEPEHYGYRVGTPDSRAGTLRRRAGTLRLLSQNTPTPSWNTPASAPEHYDPEPERYGSRAGTLRFRAGACSEI
jgi:hypothetical protein